MIRQKHLFTLIGDNNTGKTTLQKLLIQRICNEYYDRLPTDTILDVKRPEIKRKYRKISFSNRSYQEKEYKTVDEYFDEHFQDANIAFLSSHLILEHIEQIIINGRRYFLNVYGVFLLNSIVNQRERNIEISLLGWGKRFVAENLLVDSSMQVASQLNSITNG